ncbi:MAG: FAD-dependent oxidoreductase [Candidatus Marinimicrobia bacterium]|nr:FAD-dependent oxidoreductase [Candidatus Neomarinimicrobiota bacterium]
MESYDVAVIGSGPGGYAAAIRSAQRGMKTVVIEKESVGGVCLNWGCIPTKAIIHSVDTLAGIRNAAYLGIGLENVRVDMKTIIARSRNVAGRLSKGVAYLLKKHDVSFMKGVATLQENHTLQVRKKNEGRSVSKRKILSLPPGRARRNFPA